RRFLPLAAVIDLAANLRPPLWEDKAAPRRRTPNQSSLWRWNISVTYFVPPIIMKTTKLLLCAALALLGPAALQAAKAPKGPVRAEVNFFEPSKFTDLKDNAMDNDNERGLYKLDTLRDYIVEEVTRLVPAGQFVSITITDIDLAGDF